MDKHTLRLVSPWLEEFDYKLADSLLLPEPGVVVAQHMPVPASWGGIHVVSTVDTKVEDDVCQVLSAGTGTGLVPGQYILTKWNSGKKVTGFHSGPYKATTPVRFLGRAIDHKELRRSVKTPIHESVYGTINVHQYPLIKLQDGEAVPQCKRISSDTYESYICLPAQSSPAEVKLEVPSICTQFSHTVALATGKSYRIRVRTNSIARHLDITCEEVGDDTKEILNVIDRKLPIRPTGRWILVELDDLRDKSAGGIILPDSCTSRDSKATVIEAGYMVGMNRSGQYREDRIGRGDRVIVMSNALHHLFIPELDGVKSIKLVHEDAIVTRLLEDAPEEALAS